MNQIQQAVASYRPPVCELAYHRPVCEFWSFCFLQDQRYLIGIKCSTTEETHSNTVPGPGPGPGVTNTFFKFKSNGKFAKKRERNAWVEAPHN